ncbi:LptA/OstA family protein [Serratia grimesii]|uniref:LptA/OstA family protein n=1 Tax=Serratia grimesii TaxID=82995 RepID=UPI0039AFCF80
MILSWWFMHKRCLLLACFFSLAFYSADGFSKGNPINSDKQLVFVNGDAEYPIYHRIYSNGFFFTASSVPLRYRGRLENGSPLSGMSKRLKYVIKNGVLTLSGDAFVRKNNNTPSVVRINYNINTKKLAASSQPRR